MKCGCIRSVIVICTFVAKRLNTVLFQIWNFILIKIAIFFALVLQEILLQRIYCYHISGFTCPKEKNHERQVTYMDVCDLLPLTLVQDILKQIVQFFHQYNCSILNQILLYKYGKSCTSFVCRSVEDVAMEAAGDWNVLYSPVMQRSIDLFDPPNVQVKTVEHYLNGS